MDMKNTSDLVQKSLETSFMLLKPKNEGLLKQTLLPQQQKIICLRQGPLRQVLPPGNPTGNTPRP